MRRKNNQFGFTLVELLVVIGIIALLISILLPALSKARDTAMRVVCMARMKQLGNASLMYAADNKGSMPPIWEANDFIPGPVHFDRPGIFPSTGDPADDCYLSRYLAANIDVTKVFVCPLLQAGVGTGSNWGVQSYRYNPLIGGFRGTTVQSLAQADGYYPTVPYKMAQFRQPSRLALFVDSNQLEGLIADPTNGPFGNGGNGFWFRQDTTTLSTTVGRSYNWVNMQGSLQIHGKSTINGAFIGANGVTTPCTAGLTDIVYADGSVRPTAIRINNYPVAFQGSDFPAIDPDYMTPKW